MKRYFFVLIFIVTLCLSVDARYKQGYYDSMNGKKKETLKQAAKACVQKHTTLEYYSLPNYWQYSDVYPELVNGNKRWWDMYSNAQYLIKKGQSGTQSFSANKMQREHSVPKSWWGTTGNQEYTPAYSDMWNLYPSDASANQAKLNYPLGVTSKPTFDNGCTKVGYAQTGYGGGSANVFEPADEYKGDFARAYMYMATVYDDINWMYHYMYKKETYPTLTQWAINMLLEWSRRDPVSQKEIDRNDIVEQYQGNRNPFVDFPELAEYIWGSRTSEVFYVNNQADVDPTPPITGDPEITQPVNGEALDFGQIAVGTYQTRALQIVGKNMTSPLSVSVAGADRANFKTSVTSIPAATINQNQGYLFNIVYQPQSPGLHQAKVTLYDGGLKGSIAVTLTGEALPAPEFVTPVALDPVDVTDGGYTARWNAVPEGVIADYYILTRTRITRDGNDTETFETGETSYQITERDPEVAEIYYVQYSRLGMISPESNKIYIAAGSSVEDVMQPSPVMIQTIEGGFVVRLMGDPVPVSVYDINGVEVMHIDAPTDCQTIMLPVGIYMVAPQGGRPVKIII